ncbi:uncharacterized protein JCM6883_004226 [Sporobolomyces salmoneus]|uniref:uncharacterized protein n=1 Tax=Sporobolomyces salmoneus TaxID=183962 RepID=UPI0031726678
MLSNLPPELVREIIETTIPHSFHSTTYRTRQSTLCALSLVSKQFRAIAQPLLSEVVWVNSKRSWDFFCAGSGGGGETRERGSFLKQAILFYGVPVLSAEESRNLKQLLSSVTAFTVSSVPEASLSLSSLKSFTRLTSLHLTYIRWEVPDRLILPHVRSLTLHCVSSSFSASLLNPVVLPNLRNLAFSTSPCEAPQSMLARQLLPQLDTLRLNLWVWAQPQATCLHGAVAKTLIDLDVDSIPDLLPKTQLVPLSHVRIYGWSESDEEEEEGNAEGITIASDLDDFASFIGGRSLRALQTVFLDSHFQGSKLPYLQRSIENLIRVCQEKKIEVVFEPVPRNFAIDPCISPEFIKRQKERKNKETGNQ